MADACQLHVGKLLRRGETVFLERLPDKEYIRILCYPRFDLKEAKKRLRELKGLNVRALDFSGEKKAFNVNVLGKGCAGIVVIAYTNAGKAALKIRRVDTHHSGMQHEAEMLKRANDVAVGPRLLDVTKSFLLMEFIDGLQLPKWIENLRGRGIEARILGILRDVLEQCWQLDELGLDHGELSQAPEHIIVSAKDTPCLVDFETASVNRKVSNVTSICNYLFMRSQLARTIEKRLGRVDTESLIHALKAYKQGRARGFFEEVLVACGL